MDWKEILPPDECSYVLGNPPFVGKHLMTAEQEQDMQAVWGDTNGAGFLDYVTGWYVRAAQYIQGTRVPVGFVSTNSICQGEQVGILWNELFQKYHIKIHFAHRTFKWDSEARGKAHVHVVILGFGAYDQSVKSIYDYGASGENITVTPAKNISPYLIEGPDAALPIRRQAVCNVPAIVNGNKPADGGFLIIEDADKEPFLKENPEAASYVRPFLCADEYLNNERRWVLWLVDAPPALIRESRGVKERVEAVRDFRLKSPKESTRRRADRPALFDQIRQPTGEYILVPRPSSENRKYIPFGFFGPKIIIGDSCTAIPDATLYHFGVLSSAIHMAWMRQVCGRLESRYRCSNKLVYNNYPWPQSPTTKQKEAVEAAAQKVLEVRAQFPGASLADLYDPLSMPPGLVKAHAELDRAVDLCYRSQPFTSERQRVEYLFGLYEQLTAPLLPVAKPKRAARKKAIYAKPPRAPVHPSLTPEQAQADAAHFYSAKEEPPPYRA